MVQVFDGWKRAASVLLSSRKLLVEHLTRFRVYLGFIWGSGFRGVKVCAVRAPVHAARFVTFSAALNPKSHCTTLVVQAQQASLRCETTPPGLVSKMFGSSTYRFETLNPKP